MFWAIVWIICLKKTKMTDFTREITFPNFEAKIGNEIAWIFINLKPVK